MSEKTKRRIREISRRVCLKRRRSERRTLSALSGCTLLLLVNIGLLLKDVHSPGIANTQAGYGAVLLHEGTSTYIVVGLAAFILGVGITVLCLRLRNRPPPTAPRKSRIDPCLRQQQIAGEASPARGSNPAQHFSAPSALYFGT